LTLRPPECYKAKRSEIAWNIDLTVRVFLTVGTDHHPFDRLILWLDRWLRETVVNVSCVEQIGSSEPPAYARYNKFVPYEDIRSAMNDADVIVSHAGPGSVLMAENVGHRPVVVPRRKEFGEAVDNHQVVFARWLSSNRIAHVAEDEVGFQHALAQVVAAGRFRRPQGFGHSRDVALRFGQLMDELLASNGRRHHL
jgi:UDP-N-acetylglucosamine transferase subunit ALG13